LAEINIPQTHPSGTYWYHVHKHGSATYQFLGGMAGFLIINGGAGTLDTVPEVAAAKDVPMAFQIVRSLNNGSVVFVNEKAEQFGTFPFSPPRGALTHRARRSRNRVSGPHTAWMVNSNRMAN
jgi:FtsP/CotA-like multicopper oxidase with cupredoxin domain